MDYRNPTSRYLKEPFQAEGFAAYVKARMEALEAPMAAPPYAGGTEQKRLDELGEYVRQNPYAFYEKYNAYAQKLIATSASQMVTRTSDPVFFDCMQDCCQALGFDNLTGYVYTQKQNPYNAVAFGYMDMTWIMVSGEFRRNNRLDDLELSFVIGHELGHNAARHTSIESVFPNVTREEMRGFELTADRAGLLAALWRVQKRFPSLNAQEMAQKALQSGVSALRKLHILNENRNVNYTDQTLKLEMDRTPVAKRTAKGTDSHPTCWERIRALEEYVQRIEFLVCMRAMWGEGRPAARGL